MVDLPRVWDGRAGWYSMGGVAVLPSIYILGGCANCWACWVALWGRKLNIWKGMIYCKPIWDVFAPQRGWGRAGERLTTGDLKSRFPNRQPVPVGFLRLRNAPGLIGLSCSSQEKSILLTIVYLQLFQPFPEVRERQEWVVGMRWIWMTFQNGNRA